MPFDLPALCEFSSGYTIAPRFADKLPVLQSLIYRYLIAKATYRPRADKRTGIQLDAGQCLLTLTFIENHFKSLRLSRARIKSTMDALRDLMLINIELTTDRQRGLLVTIRGYSKLQALSSYNSQRIDNESTTNPPGTNEGSTTNRHNITKELNNYKTKEETVPPTNGDGKREFAEHVLESWNRLVDGTVIPKIRALNETRIKNIDKYRKDLPTKDHWERAIVAMLDDPHWTGESDGWFGKFDSFVRPTTNQPLKFLELYDDSGAMAERIKNEAKRERESMTPMERQNAAITRGQPSW